MSFGTCCCCREDHEELGYPAGIIVAIEYVFALSIGLRVGFHYRMPFETYLTLGLVFAGIGISLIVLTKLRFTRAEPNRRRFGAFFPSFLIRQALRLILSALQITALTWMKIMLPVASPFLG